MGRIFCGPMPRGTLNSAKLVRHYAKINFPRQQHDTRKNPKQSGVVAVDNCFDILVAHQYGATNREALLKNKAHSVLEPL